MKWPCDEVTRQLEAFLDGEVGADAQAHLEAHLQACERCRRVAESLRELGATLRGAAGEASLAPGEAAAFWPAVRARMREAEAEAERRSVAGMARAVARMLRAPILVPALAIFLGVVLGVGILRTEHLVAPAEAAEVESLEGGPASTVMLLQKGGGKPPIIWIFEDGAGAN